MSPVLLLFGILLAVASANAFNVGCPVSGVALFSHIQDVSPDMTPFINRMKSGALQEFEDWANNAGFSAAYHALASFTHKAGACWSLRRGFTPSSILPTYNAMPTNVGTNQPQRAVLDVIARGATTHSVIIVYANKEPSYPPTAGSTLAPFNPNTFDCTTQETPTMAELTAYMTTGNAAFVKVVFVVPDGLISSYRSAFGWLGSKLSVVSEGTDKDTLVDAYAAAMNEIYCGIDPPTIAPQATTASAIPVCAPNTVLQLLHLQDFSWSYTNDMANLKAKMPSLLATLDTQYFQRQVALGTFVDKPMTPSGYSNDYCYREESQFSTDETSFIAALNAATVRSGRDWAESQYDALRDGVQSTTLGWLPGATVSVGGVSKGLLRVVMLATDAGPHTKGDQPGLPATHLNGCAYADYPSHADIKTLLETYDVYPIFVVTNDIYDYYNYLMNNEINTTGKVLRLGDPSTDIIDAIAEALESICVRRLSTL